MSPLRSSGPGGCGRLPSWRKALVRRSARCRLRHRQPDRPPAGGRLAVPAVLQSDGSVAELGAGDQVVPVVLVSVLEQPSTLARNIGVRAQAELVAVTRSG